MLTLPNDLLLLVGDLLDDHHDRYNLIFVCQRFHDLFLRVLYRSAELRNCHQTQSFLQGILRRPELARVVRSLDFDKWQPQVSGSLLDDRASISQWVQSVSHSEEEGIKWEQDLLAGAADAWIALLLPLVNNIRQLRVISPTNNRYLDRVLQRAVNGEKPFDQQPAFQALQEVSLSHLADEETRGSYLPSQIMPFFQLPSMRVVSADAVIESRPPREDDTPEPNLVSVMGSSKISEITLKDSNGFQGMESLIVSCASLKSFKYQHSDNHLLAEGYQPAAFYKSLARSKKSLQTLWLDNCGTHLPFTISGVNETHDEWFGSLSDFTALKDLRIRLPNLLDVRYQPEPSLPLIEILPRSVECLYVEGCKENSLAMLLRQLQLVLKERKSRFVGLRRLDIEGFFHDDDEDEDSGSSDKSEKVIKPRVYAMTEDLRLACVDAGVELHVRDRVCLQTMG